MKTKFPVLPVTRVQRLRESALVVILLAGTLLSAGAFAADPQRPDPRPKLVLLLAEKSYDTPASLAGFSTQHLERDFRVVSVIGSMTPGENAFDRIEEVTDADVMLVSVVRRAPPQAQLDAIRRFIMNGKPIVGIRTANHAFALSPGQKAPAGGADWPAWDAEVIGGHYSGHYRTGPVATITAPQPDHPILRGVALPFTFHHQLYKVNPLRLGATAILIATIPEQAPEPVAWTFTHVGGGRTFYTSLGTTADFKNPAFTTLLRNGIFWAAGNLGRKSPDTFPRL